MSDIFTGPYSMECGTCKKFIGKYALFGTDHNAGFVCAECLKKQEKKNGNT